MRPKTQQQLAMTGLNTEIILELSVILKNTMYFSIFEWYYMTN